MGPAQVRQLGMYHLQMRPSHKLRQARQLYPHDLPQQLDVARGQRARVQHHEQLLQLPVLLVQVRSHCQVLSYHGLIRQCYHAAPHP